MRVVNSTEAKRLLTRGITWPWDSPPASVRESIARLFGSPLTPEQAVTKVLREVKSGGDRAVREYTRRLDSRDVSGPLEVPAEVRRQARQSIDGKLLEALEFAAERVMAFHRASLPRGWTDFKNGYGEAYLPLERAGLYIPGGTAVYPSTVLMTAIPARVAGVKEVLLCSPAWQGEWPHPAVLAAADLVGVDRVFRIGGAQAIAAMAYGTESVPRVDIVCGPGNLFVTLAKKLVFGDVAVDGLYGPTETVLIADDSASPSDCAADLLAQAEHDALASPIFLTTSEQLLQRVQEALARQLATAPRRQIAERSLETNGIAVLVQNLEQAIELANAYAPEHLCLLTREPWALVEKVRNAGAVFVGSETPEVLGDYTAGPSHVMPTGGTARFSSPLGVRQFLKTIVLVAQDAKGLRRLAPATAAIAEAEGLHGHAAAVRARLNAGKDGTGHAS
ncbi:MAG: histidinol dehydrogenase [Dehalococcoidia bacterium]|nr:histidinol dehydrogenase [Dehalococcoidia bacterium]